VRDVELEAREPKHLRAGARVSAASFAWTIIASAVAVLSGLAAGSIVLVAFGMTGILDALGSATLVVHFRHALRHEVFSERHERVALRVVTLGLAVVGMFTVGVGIERLATHGVARSSALGFAVAALSVVVLTLLAWRKEIVGRRIPSRALRADGRLSGTGALLALVTVVGTGLTVAYGWWWADPVAALGVGGAAVLTAARLRQRPSVGSPRTT
jgi:divalent metal cation (Fe/Co/Zn/Cd) transporter